MESRISSIQQDVNGIKDRQYVLEARVDVKMAGFAKDIRHIQEFRRDTKANFSKVIWLVIITGLLPLVKDVISV